ncbi:O-antigen translocase [Pseudoalteromonas luteoviolacea]|uniref:O-antigen translocase n=1 Tax=Pseudoalteromonas luteoviolacea TaxID=43657 RepID=UPI001F33EDB2|nr:O-antigen translocase [Pseudoalteromonas luteoviolacea]MCF6439047.1 O-antigen translocase [Pseudoalteromonas luteoviolacea]
MNLLKTSLLNGVAVIIKIATLLGINKVLAIYLGPSGYALIGQFQNAVQMLTTFASGALNTGVTKYTAQHYDDEATQIRVWSTAGTFSIGLTTLFSLLIFIFNQELASYFLKDESLSNVFSWFAIALVFFVINALLLAILNGKKEIPSYVLANIIGSLASLVFTCLLTYYWGTVGALISLATYQSISCLATIIIISQKTWFKLRYLVQGVDWNHLQNLSKFTLMALTSALCVPLSHILVRGFIGDSLGMEAAGYWEALFRFSNAYLMLVTMTLGVYYLPRLSELKENIQIRKEVLSGYLFILPMAIVASFVIFLIGDSLITLLFSEEFTPVAQLLPWQLVGDVIKIASWLLGYVLTARAFFKAFMASEIIFSLLFVVLVKVFVSDYGLEGAAIAYAANYLLHFCFLFYYLKRKDIL